MIVVFVLLHYPLIFFAVLSCVSATPTRDDESKEKYVLATVLFYCNEKGDKIVAAGEVPKKVNMIIKKDVERIYNNKNTKIVPIYRKYSDVPKINEVYNEIRNKHDKVFTSSLPEGLSSRLVEKKSKLFEKNGKVSGIQRFKREFVKNKSDLLDKDIESNVVPTTSQDYRKSLSVYMKAGSPDVEGFVPNTVYYAAQLKYRTNDKIIKTLKAMLNEPKKKI
ncbi:hypothetical protein HF086_008683 [Spodoptera exigua]|uniref:Uncharacterized protein n=1 Tax=Spodoptera exigua TaxID=7107 RepID=A0A922SNW4_SPOEX|nr:hypothetical protein HF086_008683 [Spodoptera exigua]